MCALFIFDVILLVELCRRLNEYFNKGNVNIFRSLSEVLFPSSHNYLDNYLLEAIIALS